MWTVTWHKQDPLCTVHCTGDGLYTAQHTIMGWVDTGHSCSSSAQCQQLLREWKCIFSPYLGCFIADLSSTRWSLWRFVVFDREPAPANMWRFKKKLFGQVAKYLWCRIEEWWVMVIVASGHPQWIECGSLYVEFIELEAMSVSVWPEMTSFTYYTHF